MKLYKFFTAIGAIALAAGFTACSDDDDVYSNGFGGVDGQVVLAPTVNESYKFIKIPGEVMTPTLTWRVAPRSRVRAAEDITMKFAIDNSLIDAYNAENSTEYVALPDGVVTMDVDEATITPGNTSAEAPVTVKMTDDANLLSQLVVGTDYIVPIRMTSVIKGNARIAVSAPNVSYLTFTMSEELINPNGSPTGTLVSDRSGWSISVEGNIGDASGCLNGSLVQINSSASYNVTLDMGKVYSFDGIYSECLYWGWDYSDYYGVFRSGNRIALSSDKSNWTDLGDINKTFGTDLPLYGTLSARYIRFTIVANRYRFWSSNLNIYEK